MAETDANANSAEKELIKRLYCFECFMNTENQDSRANRKEHKTFTSLIFLQAMHHSHLFLAASTTIVLLSCVLARSFRDENFQKQVSGDATNSVMNIEALLEYLLDNQHLLQDDVLTAVDSRMKRTWTEGEYGVPSNMKRKMFWTPLGHLPASARLGRPQASRTSSEESGSPIFRYG